MSERFAFYREFGADEIGRAGWMVVLVEKTPRSEPNAEVVDIFPRGSKADADAWVAERMTVDPSATWYPQ